MTEKKTKTKTKMYNETKMHRKLCLKCVVVTSSDSKEEMPSKCLIKFVKKLHIATFETLKICGAIIETLI